MIKNNDLETLEKSAFLKLFCKNTDDKSGVCCIQKHSTNIIHTTPEINHNNGGNQTMTQKNKQNINQKVVSFELSAVKVEQLNKQPIIESNLSVSEDGKWVIHKTIITDIKPVSYMQKVLENN